MRAITIAPGIHHSARLDEMPEPSIADGSLLVRALALGVCGTDREIIEGQYGTAPPGEPRLILGHESLGVIEDAPADSGFARGDHVVGVVRRPDPLPCPACAAGEWDMCRNGLYTERGIKARHGFGAERFRLEPDFAVKIDSALGLCGVLLEPASVVAKAWDHADAVGRRSRAWSARTLLVTGAGPIGLLAALLGRQRDLDVHIYDHNTEGPKPRLSRALGASYHNDADALSRMDFDIVMECTAVPSVIAGALRLSAPSGIVCLLGVSAPGGTILFDMGAVNRKAVLNNEAVFGSVNANRSHYAKAADALARADRTWLEALISRRVPLNDWHEALERRPDDIKVVITF